MNRSSRLGTGEGVERPHPQTYEPIKEKEAMHNFSPKALGNILTTAGLHLLNLFKECCQMWTKCFNIYVYGGHTQRKH